ncbi:MAG: lipoyl(octanoyl) transferase LipB [Saprospiraceae bacterium]|nr:lipoyl(octanoyl) transferase LipB [Saprospiraceae bacterium]
MQTVQFRDLNFMDYQSAWDFQTSLHRGLIENKLKNRDLKPGTYPQAHQLLLVEHPPVYTLGKSGSMDNLLLSADELRARGIQFFPINRGGDITFHGPGQIVGYPILDLECFFTDVHRYVRNIEEVIIRTLAEYDVEAFRIKDYTGVWVKNTANLEPSAINRKICAIGVHLSRWVTLHGWAFNINTPLEYFNYIVPCGIADEDKTVTSLAAETGRPVDMQAVKERLKRHFAAVFECEIAG